MSQTYSRSEMYNHIEDIIEARNDIGQFCAMPPAVNIRYVYSTPSTSRADELRDVARSRNLESGAGGSGSDAIGPTDSEITLCRVKQENSSHARRCKASSNWEVMHDAAIPGDGTHLGDSPSMVNLVTFVVQADTARDREFMVPLSSWEPTAEAPPTATSLFSDAHEDVTARSPPVMSHVAASTDSRLDDDDSGGSDLQVASTSTFDCPASIGKPKKSASFKDLFRRMAFWRRESRTHLSASLKHLEGKKRRGF